MDRAEGRRRGVNRVRDYLVASLHSGRLLPGERVRSVRELASDLVLDPKTVHRAYRMLVAEGLLESRPGSGTFVAEVASKSGRAPSASKLLVAANHCRVQAATLGMSPAGLAAFLHVHFTGGLREFPLAVAECNREQVGVVSLELRRFLEVRPKPVLLDDLRDDLGRTLGRSKAIVSTDFHFAEVDELVRPRRIPVYRIALEPSVSHALLEHAKKGPMIMVVEDASFVRNFLRYLSELGATAADCGRVRIVEPKAAPAAFLAARDGGCVYVSPLVEKMMEGRIPERFQRLQVRRHVAAESMERLRARLAADVASGRVTR